MNIFLEYDNLVLREKQKHYQFNNKEPVYPASIIEYKEVKKDEVKNRHAIKNTGRIGFGPVELLGEIYADSKSKKRDREDLSFGSLSLNDKDESNKMNEPINKKKKGTTTKTEAPKNKNVSTKVDVNKNKPSYLSSSSTSRPLPVGSTSGVLAARDRLKNAGIEWGEDSSHQEVNSLFSSSSSSFNGNGDLNQNIQKQAREATMRQQKLHTRKFN